MKALRTCVLTALLFVLSSPAFAQPGPAMPRTPSSDVTGSTIAFTWQSAATATWYQFWLGRGDTTLVMEQWYTAEHAGCAGGGTCTVTLTPPLTAGAFVWYVRTWSSAGYGPWSVAFMFTMRDVVQAWSGALPPSRRFTLVLNAEAVLDNETGLVWQRIPADTTHQWQLSRWYCAVADTGSRAGWRVPTLSELQSLLNRANPSLPPGHPFVVTGTPWFWTNTASTQAADFYFRVSAADGSLAQTLSLPDFVHRNWCVRGGASPAY
jgi:hypothetical protein